MRKHAYTAVVLAVFALASCTSDSATDGDSSADAPIESSDVVDTQAAGDDSATDGDDAPGLTAEEIDDDTLEVLGSYDIDGDELEDGVDGPPPAEAVEIFELYTSLIPADYRDGVVAFVAIDQVGSDGTDGALQDVTDADGEPTGERYIALDTSGSSDEIERTIVHESGHYFFVTPGSDSNPYQDDFNALFPPGADYDAESFVTEYAASVPDGAEDIAESWAMFVYGGTEFAGDADDDGELDEVIEGTLAAEKVAFFEDYPELVALRAFILGE